MEDKRYAVLIDADNTSSRYIKTIIDEVTKEGIITYNRIYGDWTSGNLQKWREVLLRYALTPVQQFAYTSKKNSTDSAMIIDAMDILYSGEVDGFCIVSSDCDFTRLATRLREAGKNVIGMGRTGSVQAFVAACNVFKYIDLLTDAQKPAKQKSAEKPSEKPSEPAKAKKQSKSAPKAAKPTPAPAQQPAAEVVAPPAAEPAPAEPSADAPAVDLEARKQEVKEAIDNMLDENSDADGFLLASTVGTLLQRQFSDFDSRNYGFKKTIELLRHLGYETKSDNGKVYYIGKKSK